MLYPAIIFDLDGTAIPSVEVSMPPPGLISVTNKYKDKIHLCAATGRSWPFARDIIRALGLADPCILSGGATIVDPVREVILWQETIDQKSLETILKIARGYNYPLTCAIGLTHAADPKKTTSILADVNTLYIKDIPGDKFTEVIEQLAGIKHITVSKAHSWKSKNCIDLHITNKQATKEHAVIELCRMLGVNRADVAGVGDGYNDVHLFNSVGHKIAMGNAVPELKELADEVIGSLDQDGLGRFIESAAGKS